MTIEGTAPAVDREQGTREQRSRKPFPFVSYVALAVILGLIGILGANASANTSIVFAVVAIAAAVALVNSRPVIWIALAITLVWTSRLFTVLGSAPRFLDFLDFPLVLIAFVFAGVRYLGDSRVLPPAHRKIGQWILVVSVIIAISWAFNDFSDPKRLIAGWALAMEPFLLLLAVMITPMSKRERRLLLVLTTTLLCGQVVFSVVEIVVFGAVQDAVKGTLFAAGAGHHVSVGGLIVGFLILAKQPVPRLITAAYGALALFVGVTADAKQVLFVLPVALLVLGVTGRRRKSAASLIGGVVVGLVMAGGAVFALLTYQASNQALEFIDSTATNRTGKVAVAEALWHDITESAPSAAFGLGPGETVSRFAFLTTPALFKQGSPVALLGLEPSRGADHYENIAVSGPFSGDSSFTGAQSSALGILGDYGLVGVAGFGALILAVLGALRRARTQRPQSSALAAWALLIPLAVVFDWLEQPPFTLAVMLITGLALRDDASLDAEPAQAGSWAVPEGPPAVGSGVDWSDGSLHRQIDGGRSGGAPLWQRR